MIKTLPEPSYCVTLTTDFGVASPFVGAMKAVLLSQCPRINTIDLFHDVAPFDVAEAGFWLGRSFQYSPAGSVHVAVVDPGVGTQRKIITARYVGHFFLAPDNGLLDQVFGKTSGVEYRELRVSDIAELAGRDISRTFHGRDIFAPVAAVLASAPSRFETLGPVLPVVMASPFPKVVDTLDKKGKLQGFVISIDRYGNLITNIDAQYVKGLSVSVECAGHRLMLKQTYADGQPGGLLAIINSLDVIEIACTEGSAVECLGIKRGATVTIERM